MSQMARPRDSAGRHTAACAPPTVPVGRGLAFIYFPGMVAIEASFVTYAEEQKMGVRSKNGSLKKPQMTIKERRAEKRARAAEERLLISRRKRDRV